MNPRLKPVFRALVIWITTGASFSAWTVTAQTVAPTPTVAAYSESKAYEPRVFLPPEKQEKEKKPKKENGAKSVVPEIPGTISTPKPLSIPVSVFDGTGKVVGGLQPSDFKVFIDDQEQPLVSVELRDEPVNLILLFDTSPSTDYRIKGIQELARELVRQRKPDDKVMVCSFNIQFKVMTELSSDGQLIDKAISKLRMGDGTSIYDAVDELFRKRISDLTGRKVVVIFTDGVDTTSRRSTYIQSLIEAEKRDAAVYVYYFDTYEEYISGAKSALNANILNSLRLSKPALKGTTQAEMERGRFYLNDLIRLSGGRVIRQEDGTIGNTSILGNLPQELHAQYVLTLTPSGPESSGQRRKIRVRVNRPHVIVLARGSYVR